MYWADKFVKNLLKTKKYQPYHVDDMKTPSGRVHVGALRGVVIHDLIYKVLQENNKKAVYTFCINDMDPMDGFPIYLDKAKFLKYMGCPLVNIPSPEKGYQSFSECYAKEFIKVFNSIGCKPEIVWTSKLYKEGKFDPIIKQVLDNTDKIRKLFKDQYTSFKEENYFPYQPICPKCSKISTTKIYKWDDKYVYFECIKNAVTYTQGCGYKGKLEPKGLNGKMPWKIEWCGHWKLLGVTIEWAGKDHMTEGGSHEIAAKISEQILNYPTPQPELYEHLLVGGKKMSSSKGQGSSAKEIAVLLPPQLLRFLMVKTYYRKTIDFNPNSNTIPDLFDEYDLYASHYYQKDNLDMARVWELSQINKPPSKLSFLPRFRDVANFVQSPSIDIVKKFEEVKGSKLTPLEKNILRERIKYCTLWLKDYAPEELVFNISQAIPKEAEKLSLEQKKYLINLIRLISQKDWQPEVLQSELYNLSKQLNIPPKLAFQAIYLSLIGKTHGPKAAWMLMEQKALAIKRFKEMSK